MPRVSVITALFNHERYVGQAIESMLAQTYGDWELIVWDDGSTDGGLKISAEYARNDPDRIRLFSHPGGANRGQENTRNAALDKCRGELIGLLDSDDFYEPRKLELLIPCFDDLGVGLAYGRAQLLADDTGRRNSSGIIREPQGGVFAELAQENFICAGATLFRRSASRTDAPFDSSFRTIGEYPLWLRLARDWKVAHVPEVVAVWRSHGANLGKRLAVEAKAELVALCERMVADPEYVEHRACLKRARAIRRYDYASELYAAMQIRRAGREYRRTAADPAAPPAVRAKAAVMFALGALGEALNRGLSRMKRAFWQWRRARSAGN